MPQCQDWREVTTQDAVNPIESLDTWTEERGEVLSSEEERWDQKERWGPLLAFLVSTGLAEFLQ